MNRFLVLLLSFLFKVNRAVYDVNNVTGNFAIFYDEPVSVPQTNVFYDYLQESSSDDVEILKLKQFFDFIIIGSGSSGAVVANRLSENPEWNVLLLEAGQTPTKLADIPIMMNYFQFTDYNWGYLMEKQDNMCLGLEGQRMHWPRGKVLGGTSVINYMIHIRGNRLDFDRWAENGNEGWSYEQVLPYFKKSEDYLVKSQDPGYHQRGGYLGVEDVPYRSKSVDAFVRAMQEFGYKYVDYNGKDQIGVSYVHATTRNHGRASAYNAFLEPVRQRKNLRVYTGARVTKILINKSKRAYGVRFVKNRKQFVARASKEVILSAGAFNSPQLLMLSGVGPKNHLEQLRIPVLQDLPVGQKLYDHLTFLGLIFTVNESITLDYNELRRISSILRYVKTRNGAFTSIGGVEALGIVKTPNSDEPNPSYPDIEFIFVGAGLHTDKGEIYRRTFRVTDRHYDAIWKPLENRQAFSILPMLYHPKSYGFVKLKSRNPFHRPELYGNYFTDPENLDVKTFISAVRLLQAVVQMPSLRRYDAKLWNVTVPGCEGHRYDSDPYWECALRHLSVTLHHQVATCKMGPSADPEAVVNDRLKVHGVDRLRVADTSIIPEPITAHTNVPAFMIGEKAADMIKQYWLNI